MMGVQENFIAVTMETIFNTFIGFDHLSIKYMLVESQKKSSCT